MARNKSNMLVDGFGGGIGSKMVIRTRGDRTYLVRKAVYDPNRPRSEKQEEVVMKFNDAVLYAKGVMQDAELKRIYDAASTQYNSGYNIAVADAVRPPKISDLRSQNYSGSIGNVIMVKVVDDFKVDKVTISILDSSGVLLEEGPAVLERNNRDWSYTTTQLNPVVAGSTIRVSATDLPGNLSTLDQVL